MNETNEEVSAGYFPAMETISSGKTFRPSKALRNKYWFTAIMVAVALWFIVIGSVYGMSYLISLDEGWSHALFISQWLGFASYWTIIANLVWLIPALIGIPVYINSIEYSVISESGEASPEIYVRKGIINITKKHVPFRTVTNISSRAGVFDRLFRIGNVEIQTAGYSGGPGGQTGPEEKLEGIKAFEALTRFVLGELRKFRGPYATATEVSVPQEEAVVRIDGSLDDEILLAIRDIREILRTKL
ncbi:MAG: PH domain-containing protein [Candidatus Thorarchaeota archaeon]|nr:PH domain-containing protein [Candidatus Thorarchaeota archaeon]